MAIIELTHGGVSTRGHGAMDIFVSYRDVPTSEDQPLHLAVKDPNSGVKEPGGIVQSVPSSRIVNGKHWTTRRVDFPPGSYVRFTIKRMKGGQIGAFSHSFHNLIVSPRDGAPLQELRIAVPSDANAVISAVYIIGRFDILRVKEIVERKLNRGNGGSNDLASYDIADMADFMSLTVKEASVRPRATAKVLTNTQTGKGVVRVRRARRIILPG